MEIKNLVNFVTQFEPGSKFRLSYMDEDSIREQDVLYGGLTEQGNPLLINEATNSYLRQEEIKQFSRASILDNYVDGMC